MQMTKLQEPAESIRWNNPAPRIGDTPDTDDDGLVFGWFRRPARRAAGRGDCHRWELSGGGEWTGSRDGRRFNTRRSRAPESTMLPDGNTPRDNKKATYFLALIGLQVLPCEGNSFGRLETECDRPIEFLAAFDRNRLFHDDLPHGTSITVAGNLSLKKFSLCFDVSGPPFVLSSLHPTADGTTTNRVMRQVFVSTHSCSILVVCIG